MVTRIAFLFTGRIRGNSLGDIEQQHSSKHAENYQKFIFHEEFKQRYHYDIFISTDKIDKDKVIELFGKEHVINIHTHDDDFYLRPVEQTIPPDDFFLEKYNQLDFAGNRKYENSIHQQYKIADAWNMLISHTKDENYDFIVRIRLDNLVIENIMPIIHSFENDNELQIIGEWDLFAVGRPSIMKYLCSELIYKMGTYEFNENSHSFESNIITRSGYNIRIKNKHNWKYSNEIQYFEHLFYYCESHGLSIDKVLRKIHFVVLICANNINISIVD
jgi:hypothetical protein